MVINFKGINLDFAWEYEPINRRYSLLYQKGYRYKTIFSPYELINKFEINFEDFINYKNSHGLKMTSNCFYFRTIIDMEKFKNWIEGLIITNKLRGNNNGG
ncbi:MAG: hypothetical protein ACOCP8_06305 [archaeon]